MLKQRYYSRTLFAAMIAVLLFAFEINAQEKIATPELSVSGIKLGDRASAKAFLTGYSPRTEPDGRPAFYFYNKFATQVVKLTSKSFDDPYFITEIEVFAVGRSYQDRHFQTEKIGYFTTENGIFIGFRQGALSIIVGIPGVDRRERIGPNDVIKIKGSPNDRVKTGDEENVTYGLARIELPDEVAAGKINAFNYSASYKFNKNKLRRFVISISPEAKLQIADGKP